MGLYLTCKAGCVYIFDTTSYGISRHCAYKWGYGLLSPVQCLALPALIRTSSALLLRISYEHPQLYKMVNIQQLSDIENKSLINLAQ